MPKGIVKCTPCSPEHNFAKVGFAGGGCDSLNWIIPFDKVRAGRGGTPPEPKDTPEKAKAFLEALTGAATSVVPGQKLNILAYDGDDYAITVAPLMSATTIKITTCSSAQEDGYGWNFDNKTCVYGFTNYIGGDTRTVQITNEDGDWMNFDGIALPSYANSAGDDCGK